jgi:transposase-like protein
MRRDPEPALCFECDEPAEHKHHVVPKSKGGRRTLPLCTRCHSKVHDKDLTTMRALALEAMKRARASGVKFGRRKYEWTPEKIASVQGLSVSAAARALGCSPSTLRTMPGWEPRPIGRPRSAQSTRGRESRRANKQGWRAATFRGQRNLFRE